MSVPFPLLDDFEDRARHPRAPSEILGNALNIKLNDLVHERRAVFSEFLRRHFVIECIPQWWTALILTHQQMERFGSLFRVECFGHFVNGYSFNFHKFCFLI